MKAEGGSDFRIQVLENLQARRASFFWLSFFPEELCEQEVAQSCFGSQQGSGKESCGPASETASFSSDSAEKSDLFIVVQSSVR